MANAPDTSVVTGQAFVQVRLGDTLVTPTKGTQGTLANFLASPVFSNLPTSSAGLAPGTVWNNGGVLCVA